MSNEKPTKKEIAEELLSTMMMVEGTYVILPLKMIKAVGYHSAAFLQYLMEVDDKILEDIFFPIPIEEVKESRMLSREMQDNSIKKLMEFNLIETKLSGIPAKRHFKINYDEIEMLMYRTKL
jgi:hypothetical protein